MIDPVRWRDAGGDAVSPRARELLVLAEKAPSLTRQQRARSSARVARLAAIPVAVTAIGSFSHIAVAAAIGAGSALVLLGAIEVVDTWREHDRQAPVARAHVATGPAGVAVPANAPPAPSLERASPPAIHIAPPVTATPSPAPPAQRGRSEPPPPEEEPPPAEQVPAPPPPPSFAAAAAPEGDSLVRETVLLEEARVRLERFPAEALSRLEQHAQEFPGGKLRTEREFLAIAALRRLGRYAEAQARGEALLARAKGSPYEERVRHMLDGGP